MLEKLRKEKRPISFDSVLHNIIEFSSLGILIGILIRIQQQHQSNDEHTLLQQVGNPGFSPACATVMQLYRETSFLATKAFYAART